MMRSTGSSTTATKAKPPSVDAAARCSKNLLGGWYSAKNRRCRSSVDSPEYSNIRPSTSPAVAGRITSVRPSGSPTRRDPGSSGSRIHSCRHWAAATSACVFEMLDGRVRSWKAQGLVTGLLPSDQVRYAALISNPDYLAVSVRFSDMMSVYHDSISDACLHDHLPKGFSIMTVNSPTGPQIGPNGSFDHDRRTWSSPIVIGDRMEACPSRPMGRVHRECMAGRIPPLSP